MSRENGGVIWRAIRPLYVGRRRPYWIVSLAAYFDESMEHWPEDKPRVSLYSIGGYIAPLDIWEDVFAPGWKNLIDNAPHPISEYKASSVRGGSGEFANWTAAELRSFGISAVQQLCDRGHKGMMGVAAVVVLPTHVYADRKARDVESLAIGVCLSEVVATMCNFAKNSGRYEPIHFVCDSRADQEMLGRALRDAKPNLEAWYEQDLSYMDFEDSKKLLPLQAADLLAYETRKDARDIIARPRSKRSRGLVELLHSHPHVAFYCNEEIVEALQDGVRVKPPFLFKSPNMRLGSSEALREQATDGEQMMERTNEELADALEGPRGVSDQSLKMEAARRLREMPEGAREAERKAHVAGYAAAIQMFAENPVEKFDEAAEELIAWKDFAALASQPAATEGDWDDCPKCGREFYRQYSDGRAYCTPCGWLPVATEERREPALQQDEDRMGGQMCVGRSRVPVSMVDERERLGGMNGPEGVLACWPHLDRELIEHALRLYRRAPASPEGVESEEKKP